MLVIPYQRSPIPASPQLPTLQPATKITPGMDRSALMKSTTLDESPKIDPSVRPLYDWNFAIAILSQTGFVMANLMMAHYPRWISFLGGSVRDVGFIMGIGALGALLLRPWTGQALTRIGARQTWALGYALFGIGTLANLFIHDLGLSIIAVRVCLVLGVACVSASSLTYVSQFTPPERQAEAIGILGVGGFLGFIIGPYLGDLILGNDSRGRSDFIVLFLTAAGTLIIPAILLFFLRAPDSPKVIAPLRIRKFVQTIRQHWPGTILLVICAFGVCVTVPLVFLVKYVDAIGLSIPGASVIGLFFLGYSAMGLLVRIGFRRGPDRFGRRRVLLVGLMVMACGMFSFLPVTTAHPWRVMFPALLCGTGHGLVFHTATTLAIQQFPSEVRGTGSALSFMMLDLGLLIGAPVLGWMAETLGYSSLFLSVGCLCLGIGVLYASLSMRSR